MGGVGKPSHCHRQGRLLFYSVANLICFGLVALLPCATISSLNIWQQKIRTVKLWPLGVYHSFHVHNNRHCNRLYHPSCRAITPAHRLYIHRTHTSAALRLTAPIWGRSARCANGTHRARFAQVPCPDPCPYSCALCPLTQPSLYPGPPLALARPLELNVSVTVRRCTVGSAVRVTPVCSRVPL